MDYVADQYLSGNIHTCTALLDLGKNLPLGMWEKRYKAADPEEHIDVDNVSPQSKQPCMPATSLQTAGKLTLAQKHAGGWVPCASNLLEAAASKCCTWSFIQEVSL